MMNLITKPGKVAKRTLAMVMIGFMPALAFGQSSEGGISQEFMLMALLTVMGLTILVLLAAIYSLGSLTRSIKDEEERAKIARGEEIVHKPSLWELMMKSLTRSVPVEKEADILLDHNYDGIRELDNHLPPWWNYLFIITVVFSAVYLVGYHVTGTWPLSIDEYNMEMAIAEEEALARRAALVEDFDESQIAFSDDASDLANGKTVYDRNCVACHREDGGGGIGPNLADRYFIHNGTFLDIYQVVKEGVQDKGMISWEAVLSPKQMRDVSSYVVTMIGTNPPDGKAPQGELFEGDPRGEGYESATEEMDSEEDQASDTEEVTESSS